MMTYWKASAITRLTEYEAMVQARENLPGQIGECQGSGAYGCDDRLDAMVRRGELKERLRNARMWLSRTEGALGVLTPEERLVLRLLYIAPRKGNVTRLCELLECEQATVYRRRDKALKKFTMALYGRHTLTPSLTLPPSGLGCAALKTPPSRNAGGAEKAYGQKNCCPSEGEYVGEGIDPPGGKRSSPLG